MKALICVIHLSHLAWADNTNSPLIILDIILNLIQ